MGREWVSPPGNLYLSIVFPRELILPRISEYSFAAALALADTITAIDPAMTPRLKWPNDVLINGAKVSGILIETGETPGLSFVIVGMGLNLTHHPDIALYPATHLAQHTDQAPEPNEAAALLGTNFQQRQTVLRRQGFAPIREAWLVLADGIMQKRVVTIAGEKHVVEILGLGANGELQVRRENGTIDKIMAGDIGPA